MKQVTKLRIYPHPVSRACPFCMMDPSIGTTDWGIVGCQFCQHNVDRYMANNYKVVNQ